MVHCMYDIKNIEVRHEFNPLRPIHKYHAVPMPRHGILLPYRAANGLECVFPFHLSSAAVSDSHLPCHVHAMLRPCRSFQGHSTERPSRDGERHGSGILCVNRPLQAELNPICLLLALLGAHHILHVSRVKVKKWKCPIYTVHLGFDYK